MKPIIPFLLAFFMASSVLAADCGYFRVVKGKVTYQKKGKKKFRKARINKKVCQGDKVKTAKDSRAKIEMADKNEINISPDTELLIEVYQQSKKVVLNVINGKVRSNVKNKYKNDKNSHYRVKTKSAVAGVRGTEFMASYDASTNQGRFVTFEGKVVVGKFESGNFVGEVEVKPGEYTSNSPGTKPHPAKQVPPRELAQMDRETNISEGPRQPANDGSVDQGADEPEADAEGADGQDNQADAESADDQGPNEEGPAGEDQANQEERADDQSGNEGNEDSARNEPKQEPEAGEADSEPKKRPTARERQRDRQNNEPGSDGTDSANGPNGDVAADGPAAGDAPGADGTGNGPDSSNGGGRGIASVDGNQKGPAGGNFVDGPKNDFDPGGVPGGGDDLGLPPPTLDNLPGGDDFGFIEPPQIPNTNPILGEIPGVCQTCNDAIINQKVRVTIVPVLPGSGTAGGNN